MTEEIRKYVRQALMEIHFKVCVNPEITPLETLELIEEYVDYFDGEDAIDEVNKLLQS